MSATPLLQSNWKSFIPAMDVLLQTGFSFSLVLFLAPLVATRAFLSLTPMRPLKAVDQAELLPNAPLSSWSSLFLLATGLLSAA